MQTKIALAILCAGLLLMECVNSTGGSTETSSKVSGVLYNEGGTRAAGAKVACIPRNHNPYSGEHGGGDSTVTDDTGGYYFETMPADTYDIISSKNDSMAFRDPVVVTNDQNTQVPHDTLKPAGSIRGVVKFEEGGDMSTVFILFFGTRTFTWPDDSGNFTSGWMPRGKYRVNVLTTTPDYRTHPDTFDVRAGMNDVLPDTIVLQYTGIPVPQGLRIEYDTMKQIVSLYWNTPTTGRSVSSYNIYKRNVDSNTVLARINATPVIDTVYTDSTCAQDQTYEYQVAVVDTSASEGVKSSGINVVAVGAYVLDTAFGTKGTGDGQFNGGSYGIAMTGSDEVFAIDGGNRRIQVFSYEGIFQRVIPLPQGNYTDLAIDSSTNIYISEESYNDFMLKLDSSGTPVDTIVGLSDPAALFIKPNGNLLVAERYTGNVVIVDDLLNRIDSISGAFTVHDMVQDSDGNIFIADASRHIIWKLDSNGVVIEQWGERGTKIGQFSYPLGLCLDAGDKLYVADNDNHRIQIFNTAGEFVGRLQLEQKACPCDLVVSDAGDIYITDIGGQYLGGDYRVLKYSPR